MGKVDLAFNMFKRASGCIRNGSSILVHNRPVNIEGLRLAPKVSGVFVLLSLIEHYVRNFLRI